MVNLMKFECFDLKNTFKGDDFDIPCFNCNNL